MTANRRTDLSLEPAHGIGTDQAFLADELEGNNSPQLPVLRPEDGTHAALAQLLQQDVAAQQQLLAAALKEQVGLGPRWPLNAGAFKMETAGAAPAPPQRRAEHG